MAIYAPISPEDEEVAAATIGAAIEVHRHFGPGFLEKIYLEALCLELHARGVRFEREKSISVIYRGVEIPGQRIDLIVGSRVIVELKAVARVDPIWEAKLISYLKSVPLRLGLILNFHESTLKGGIKRVVV
jgi:GxxExxY protein